MSCQSSELRGRLSCEHWGPDFSPRPPAQFVVSVWMVPVLGRDLVGTRRGQIVEAEAGKRDALMLRGGKVSSLVDGFLHGFGPAHEVVDLGGPGSLFSSLLWPSS